MFGSVMAADVSVISFAYEMTSIFAGYDVIVGNKCQWFLSC